jgi:hypothetical protein
MSCAAWPAPFLWLRLLFVPVCSSAVREERERTGSVGKDCRAGVEGLLARPLLVVVMVVKIVGSRLLPLASVSSRFIVLSLRPPTTKPPRISGLPSSASSIICSPFELTADSFIVALTSGMERPVTPATLPSSGVPIMVPFGLLDEEDEGRARAFSTIDCVEFCLALAAAGLPPFVGTGEMRPRLFESAKLLWMGDEAKDGDMALDIVTAVLDLD